MYLSQFHEKFFYNLKIHSFHLTNFFIWTFFLNILIKLSSFSNYSHPWADISPHIRLNEIFEGVEGLVKESPSTNHRLQEYLDQYIKVLEEDRTRFIDKVGDAGGGQYVVHFHGY